MRPRRAVRSVAESLGPLDRPRASPHMLARMPKPKLIMRLGSGSSSEPSGGLGSYTRGSKPERFICACRCGRKRRPCASMLSPSH
eukprot:10361500-Alexandrium_andersonii.AAC.1